jgi:hypothetical protein
MIPSVAFPRFSENNHRETSPKSGQYNCIAWAAEDTERWWQPGMFWIPADWPKLDCGLGALEQLFRNLGYEDCGTDISLELGFTKVALYATGGFLYTHAARQLPNGKWTSKLGKGVDIEHDMPDVVAGGLYGQVMQIMKRAIV